MSKTRDIPPLFESGMMRVGGDLRSLTADGYADRVAAQGPPLQSVPLQARRSAPGLGEYVETGVFGGIEPPRWKVLARDTDFVHKSYCVVEGT